MNALRHLDILAGLTLLDSLIRKILLIVGFLRSTTRIGPHYPQEELVRAGAGCAHLLSQMEEGKKVGLRGADPSLQSRRSELFRTSRSGSSQWAETR